MHGTNTGIDVMEVMNARDLLSPKNMARRNSRQELILVDEITEACIRVFF